MVNSNNYSIEDLIWTKEKSLSPKLCKTIIKKFEKDNRRRKGTTTIGIVESIKKTTDLSLSKYEDWKEIDDEIFKILIKDIEEYNKYLKSLDVRLNYNFLNTHVSDDGYQLQRYDNDPKSPGFYDWHTDANYNNKGIRLITFMWYLNDVEHGGETEFMNNMKIKPQTGKLVIFPAQWQYLHRALPPISSKKWICTGWVYAKLP